jgi:hypothetical protein
VSTPSVLPSLPASQSLLPSTAAPQSRNSGALIHRAIAHAFPSSRPKFPPRPAVHAAENSRPSRPQSPPCAHSPSRPQSALPSLPPQTVVSPQPPPQGAGGDATASGGGRRRGRRAGAAARARLRAGLPGDGSQIRPLSPLTERIQGTTRSCPRPFACFVVLSSPRRGPRLRAGGVPRHAARQVHARPVPVPRPRAVPRLVLCHVRARLRPTYLDDRLKDRMQAHGAGGASPGKWHVDGNPDGMACEVAEAWELRAPRGG